MGHDAGAAIVKDGEVLMDLQEERINGIKHSDDLPLHAMALCLKAAGLKHVSDCDEVVCASVQPRRAVQTVLGYSVTGMGIKGWIKKQVSSLIFEQRVGLPSYFGNQWELLDSQRVYVEHHLAHAASAYYTQTEKQHKVLIFTMDGAGDGKSTCIWKGESGKIVALQTWGLEAAIGYAYSAVTEALGYIHGDGEGTVMGLAPYGNASNAAGVFDHLFPEFDGVKLIKPTRFKPASYLSQGGSIQFHLEESKDLAKLLNTYSKEDLAAELQCKLEAVVLDLVKSWVKKTGIKHLAFAGGIFLNVKLNQRIWEWCAQNGLSQWIYPNPGDAGLALGAALYRHHQSINPRWIAYNHLFHGPQYLDEEIVELLKLRKIPFEIVDNPALIAAKELADNKIIAWFQGSMESGPRALGHRSILMSPMLAQNKDTINARVKFREGFRPFCPSMPIEKAEEYLKVYRTEKFMTISFDVKPEKARHIPAVVHVDGTLRPQMVEQSENPLFWQLLMEFGEITGDYVLLNTSFNIKGQPMIMDPKNAIKGFFDSGIDLLFMGNIVLRK